jgi:hypothetical protein
MPAMLWPSVRSVLSRTGGLTVAGSVLLLNSCAVSAQSDLDAAFENAWGGPPPAVVVPEDKYGSGPLAAIPVGLESLGQGRFALVVRETNGSSAHAQSGAVTLVYLQKVAHGWSKIGSWKEIAWGGESGGGNMTITVRRDLGPDPMMLVSGSFMAQGFEDDGAQVVRLTADKPVNLGRVPIEADDTGSGSPIATWRYHAQIRPAAGPALFSITYDGWTAPPAKDQPRTPFHQEARVVMRDGCLAPIEPLKLPDRLWTGGRGPECRLDSL